MQHHKFKIGQSVSFTSGPFGRGSANGIYKIVQLLPPEGHDNQYKIKARMNRTNESSRKAISVVLHDLEYPLASGHEKRDPDV